VRGGTRASKKARSAPMPAYGRSMRRCAVLRYPSGPSPLGWNIAARLQYIVACNRRKYCLTYWPESETTEIDPWRANNHKNSFTL